MLNVIKRFFYFPFLATLLAPLLATLIGACREGPHTERHGQTDALAVGFESTPGRLDPRYSTDAFAGRVGGLLFASLTRLGPNGEFQPYLARRWSWEDERTCVFDLADGFAFADGRGVTAADVAATYASVLAPGSGSPRRATLTGVASVVAEGSARVRFHLAAPDAAFFEGTTLGVLAEGQAKSQALADSALLASGPYRIGEIDRHRGLRLEANPGFSASPVSIPRIHVRVVPDSLTRVLELRSGTLDLVQSAIDPDTVDWLAEHEPSLTITRSPASNLQYLGMNLDHPPLADRRVRRAIAHALDRADLVEHLMSGQARVADSFLPPEHWAHTDRVRRYDQSLGRSLALLDSAGWHDPDGNGPLVRFTLSYKTTTDDLARRIAEAIAYQLARVGIDLEIRSYDWGTFFADIRAGHFHLYSLQWVGIGDPDILRQVLHSGMRPPNGVNRGGYEDAATDRLTDRARSLIDPSRRRDLYARVERRSSRMLPYIPLWWPDRVVVSSRRLVGFEPHPSGDLVGLLRAELRPFRSRD
jgi:peptide/nickel transport system substrate-binding protein